MKTLKLLGAFAAAAILSTSACEIKENITMES